MARVKLTKRIVDAAMPSDRDVFVWDRELTGFGLRVRPAGSKTFIAQCRAGGGRSGTTRRFTIGRFGTLAVEEGRLEARKVHLSAGDSTEGQCRRSAQEQESPISELLERTNSAPIALRWRFDAGSAHPFPVPDDQRSSTRRGQFVST